MSCSCRYVVRRLIITYGVRYLRKVSERQSPIEILSLSYIRIRSYWENIIDHKFER